MKKIVPDALFHKKILSIKMLTCYDYFMQKNRIILKGGQGEIVEKKSRFIATICPVESEEEAAAFFEEIKKKYWDARHNCTAMVLGENGQLTRCSDDGEPSGTAGRPMLEVLTGEQLTNIAVVVTRYFGGTLLGTGGLVRAYSQAVKEGLNNCEVGTLRDGMQLKFSVSYNEWGRVENLCRGEEQPIDRVDYLEQVTAWLIIPKEDYEKRKKQLMDICAGKILMEEIGPCTFLENQNERR